MSTVRASNRPTTAGYLPQPPTQDQTFWYFGRQHRWMLCLQAISFLLIAYSVFRFATADVKLMLFLIPMSLYAGTLGVSLSCSIRKRRLDALDHDLLIDQYHPQHYPSVDVFLPSAGEPLAMLRNTYTHVQRLQWPGPVTVWILDDSARAEVKDLAIEYGFVYGCRPDRGHLKKAGNLRYGYERSSGELIAIFDADFVPTPDYLHQLVPYMDEAEVGIVQSPQYFDTDPSMSWLQRCAGATQELFYRWVQPGRDASKAAICVGTCALYRRAALERAGGFAQIGHSEDVHTGVNLMKIGYYVRYVPVLISKGICPDSLSAFLNQQYRWCTGSMSLLADPDFHEAPFSARQRLCFWSGFLYYISTGLNAFLAPLPALAMLWFLPSWVHPRNSVWLLGAIAMYLLVLPVLFRSRWRVEVLRVQYLYSFAHAVAIVHFLTARTRGWVATGAATGDTPIASIVRRTMLGYLGFTITATWVGLAKAIAHYGMGRFWAMVALAVMAAYIQIPMLTLPLRADQLSMWGRVRKVLSR